MRRGEGKVEIPRYRHETHDQEYLNDSKLCSDLL
jgi:hypothetical protein